MLVRLIRRVLCSVEDEDMDMQEDPSKCHMETEGNVQMEADTMFCGRCLCYSDKPSGWGGRWQRIDMCDRRKWVYLCKGCDRELWRTFAGLEEWHDKVQMYRDWNLFLIDEFKLQ